MTTAPQTTGPMPRTATIISIPGVGWFVYDWTNRRSSRCYPTIGAARRARARGVTLTGNRA